IAIDTDMNKAPMLIDAAPVFMIVENVFCTYFFFELVIRFMAFQYKLNAFKDGWFIFDFCLVILIVADTWILTGVMWALDIRAGSGMGGMSILRMIRLVKLLRLSRMARLFRAVPELVIIVKGLLFASRSVCIFFLLWGMIIYIFAVLFRQLTDGQTVGDQFFQTVPAAMNTLLLNGVFSDNADIIMAMTAETPYLWPIIVFFMALVSLTIMYMLVGVLVDVVGVVATSEKEGMAVSYIAQQLREELFRLGHKEDLQLTLNDFQNLVLEPGMIKIMTGVGVDVVVLADMLDLVHEDVAKKSPTGTMTFPDLVDVVLNMRGTNPATVKDCKEQIRVTK
ncbi:unnamed protein product, partial [Polarella glacialis]